MIKIGSTRIVFILSSVVIKMPNFTYSWLNFVTGILANLREHRIWMWNSGKYESGKSCYLCPVIWCSWGGWILIMKRADRVLTMDEGWEKDISDHIKHFPGDDSGPNYGYLEGRIVKIDYGGFAS